MVPAAGQRLARDTFSSFRMKSRLGPGAARLFARLPGPRPERLAQSHLFWPTARTSIFARGNSAGTQHRSTSCPHVQTLKVDRATEFRVGGPRIIAMFSRRSPLFQTHALDPLPSALFIIAARALQLPTLKSSRSALTSQATAVPRMLRTIMSSPRALTAV